VKVAVEYATASDVSSLLRLIDGSQNRLTFSTSTDPTLAEVESWIEDAQDYIDQRCKQAWRSVQVTNEYHTIPLGQWRGGWEVEVYANRQPLRTFVAGTDKVEIFDGSNWVDLITDTGYTEGRQNDYFIAYETGAIFFRTFRPAYRRHGIRLTYKHGYSTVPRDIKDACMRLAALNILQNEDYRVILPDDTDRYSYAARIDKFEQMIEQKLKQHIFMVGPG
jgi:hypothetical protein